MWLMQDYQQLGKVLMQEEKYLKGICKHHRRAIYCEMFNQ